MVHPTTLDGTPTAGAARKRRRDALKGSRRRTASGFLLHVLACYVLASLDRELSTFDS